MMASSRSTESELPSWRAHIKQEMSENYGDDVEGGEQDPAARMFEYSVADGLGPKAGDSDETASLKDEVRA